LASHVIHHGAQAAAGMAAHANHKGMINKN